MPPRNEFVALAAVVVPAERLPIADDGWPTLRPRNHVINLGGILWASNQGEQKVTLATVSCIAKHLCPRLVLESTPLVAHSVDWTSATDWPGSHLIEDEQWDDPPGHWPINLDEGLQQHQAEIVVWGWNGSGCSGKDC